MSDTRQRLRELLGREEILVVPGAYDALLAKLVEHSGFEAVYLTGAGVANTMLGQPDVGLVTLTEMATRAAYIANAVNIPVLADADTGYGNALNVIRTVRTYEQAGVAAIQLEDQVTPKKCGHFTVRQVISVEEMEGKIRAAVQARRDPNLAIIARTDARTSLGLEEAIYRGQRYADAGADIVFVESPESIEEMRAIAAAINAPLLANMVETGRTPLLSARELQKIGYKIVIFPGSLTRIIVKTALTLLQELRQKGTTRGILQRMATFAEVNEIIGLAQIRELEAAFLPATPVPEAGTTKPKNEDNQETDEAF